MTIFCWHPLGDRTGSGEDGQVNGMPTFATHYYSAGRSPFLNLSDRAENQLAAVLADLATPDRQALSFVLGVGDRFAGLYHDVAEVRLPVGVMPAEVASVTYAHSITATGHGVSLGLPRARP